MKPKFFSGIGAGLLTGWATIQTYFVLSQLAYRNIPVEVHTNHNRLSITTPIHPLTTTNNYEVEHQLENGLEKIIYRPFHRRFRPAIVLQHGMWHGAWCWQPWQILLAEWGWETHAYSLPGHGLSPIQRPIRLCTLDYYLSFLRQEIDQHSEKPIVIGHSMGGALIQWYLKYVGDHLPAAVLVAPWVSHNMLISGLIPLLRRDPFLLFYMMADWSATPFIRTPDRAAQCFIRPGDMPPKQLHQNLGPESALVLLQHNYPFWTPPPAVHTPLLWLAGEQDTLLPEPDERCSATHYHADYQVVPSAGHNIMMAQNHHHTLYQIHTWLSQKVAHL